MGFYQTRAFDPQKMGTKKGWCEMNARLGFGISTGTYPSAKADMEAQKAERILHEGETPPNNIAVPVFFDTSSVYEHVMVCDRGIYYSDGKRLSSIAGLKLIGWGEKCDGVRVVDFKPDTSPQPQPTTGFLPARGYWKVGDRDARIGKLASFMRANYPLYTRPCALGNYFGPCLESSIRTYQKRVGLVSDGKVGKLTYEKLKSCGFKG